MTMANLRIQINPEDEKRILRKFHNIQNYILREVDDVILDEAIEVAEEMKQEVPVDTGRLKRNITAEITASHQVSIESEAIGPRGFDYAPIIENYGGRYQKGLFYFTNGINRFKKRVRRRILDGIKNIVRSKTGSTRQNKKVRIFTPRK